jgi:hypothetical protein
MKRVSLLATALPAAVGLAVPAAAAAASTARPADGSHQGKSVSTRPLTTIRPVRPDSASQCVDNNASDCFSVVGNGNHVATATDYYWNHIVHKKATLYVGYKHVPGFPNRSKWKAWTGTWFGPVGGHEWTPNCSFATGTSVSGWSNGHSAPGNGRVDLSIHGQNYTGLHKCA